MVRVDSPLVGERPVNCGEPVTSSRIVTGEGSVRSTTGYLEAQWRSGSVARTSDSCQKENPGSNRVAR